MGLARKAVPNGPVAPAGALTEVPDPRRQYG